MTRKTEGLSASTTTSVNLANATWASVLIATTMASAVEDTVAVVNAIARKTLARVACWKVNVTLDFAGVSGVLIVSPNGTVRKNATGKADATIPGKTMVKVVLLGGIANQEIVIGARANSVVGLPGPIFGVRRPRNRAGFLVENNCKHRSFIYCPATEAIGAFFTTIKCPFSRWLQAAQYNGAVKGLDCYEDFLSQASHVAAAILLLF